MIETQSAPKSGESTWLWLSKIISGLLIFIVLIIHYVVNHFIGENALLSYEDIVAYYQNPIIPIMEIFFLVFVVSHALIGLRSIILDLKPSRGALKAVDWTFTGVGAVAIVYGIWLVLAIVAKG